MNKPLGAEQVQGQSLQSWWQSLKQEDKGREGEKQNYSTSF